MLAILRNTRNKPLSKANATQLEQLTLTVSLYSVIALVIGSLGYGIYIGSDVVIANGIFSIFSIFGSGLNLAAAKLVAKPADNRFQYGYWHVEPLVLFINALLLCGICFYAIINSIESIRTGGSTVDANGIIWFGIVSGILCGAVWLFESIVAERIDSDIVRNDSREWLVDFLFSFVTFIGFMALKWLPEPWYSYWSRYADSVLVIIMAATLIPIPIRVVIDNLREILLMTTNNDPISSLVSQEMEKVRQDYTGIVSYSSHVVKVGRSYFVEVNMLVSREFPLQTIAQQDYLRKRLWDACNKDPDELWLSLCITENATWN